MTRSRSLLLAVVLLLVGAPAARADRPFSPAFSQNLPGNIALAANSQMTCPESPACTLARNASPATVATDVTIVNDFFAELFVGAAAPFSNRSSARLELPAGADVRFARLYWFGAGPAPADPAVKLVTPATTVTVTPAGPADVSTYGYYQGFADVTGLVAAGGAGRYAVGDIIGDAGAGKAAGWTLVVAYGLATEPTRNLTIFDGLRTIDSDSLPVDVDLTGFRTPKAGPVRTTVGVVAYEGDRGFAGDGVAVADTTNGPGVFTPLADASNPATNFFNSTISHRGAEVVGRDPQYSNTLGLDADLVDATGVLGNDATAARVRLSTVGDVYLPAVVTFATELYVPELTQTMTVADSSGGQAEPGDVLTYEVSGTNRGEDAAADVTVAVPVPAGTTYLSGGSYDAAANTVRFSLPSVAFGAGFTARFQVRVDPGSTAITSTATTTYKGATLGVPATLSSTVTTTRAPVRVVEDPVVTATPTPTLPTAVFPQPTVTPTPDDLSRACSHRRLVLLNVLERKGRVTLVGAADTGLAGQTVSLRYADGRQVARTRVAADGSFSATAPLPPKAHRGTNRARYSARAGTERSPELKLTRRVIVEPPVVRAGRVQLRGRIVAPLANPRAEIVISQQLSCGGAETPVARVKPNARGTFTATVAAPADAAAAIYRVSTRVRRTAKNPKTFPTFGLPQAVELR